MPSKPDSTLTPTALANHLACRQLTQLARARDELGASIGYHADPRAEAMRQRGEAHERAFVASLVAAGKNVCDLRRDGDPAKTLQAMRRGDEVLVQAALADDTMRGVADVLVRVATPSQLGAWSYEPYDTKLARDTKAGTLLQLVGYAEMLRAMQGVTPQSLHVVTPRATETYRTAEFAAYTRLVQRQLAAAKRGVPLHEACPDPVPHCEVCGYFAHCDAARRAVDHLSFVAGLSTRQLIELRRQNVTTLAALAATNGVLPEPPQRGRAETFAKLGQQAALQLQARTTRTPPVVHLAVEPLRGLCRLPEPSPGDVFLDFEGDPFVGDGGREYLTGWTLADTDDTYVARWALEASAEKSAIESFLDFVAHRLTQHPDLHVYHFGAYEPAAIRRLVQRHGTRAEFLDVLLRGGRFVDLHAVVRESLRIGIERYGLKELEPVIGFHRQLDLEDAARARRHVEIALELDDYGAIDDAVRQQVTAYNREDCTSTRALRHWLDEHRRAAMQLGADIPRPVPKDGAPSEDVSTQERRIADLAAALCVDVPADRTLRSAEHAARALLADQLAYFRREAKCAWWEFFRLRGLELDALANERNAIVGLRHERELPKPPRAKLVSHEYSFPPQETAIKAGDEVYPSACEDPSTSDFGTKLGEVASCDPERGTFVVKQAAKAATLRPTAVLEFTDVKPGVLEESLLRLGEHVQANGLPTAGPYRAEADLLLRRPPRGGTAGEALQRGGETSRDAAIRLCHALDGGVLPIQGPPGSGKSTLGAEVILQLVRDGKRVGVTATSHAVIDGLLRKVHEKDTAKTPQVRLVHKHDGEPPAGIEYLDDNDAALDAIGPGVVVGGTAWLWARVPARDRLDFLFVDEAGQMSLAQVLAAASSARNLVLIGDPQQLEQPQKGAHPEGSEVAALVHMLGREHQTMPPERGLFMPLTQRLHPTLCAFTSEQYYDGKLQSAPGLERQRLDGDTPFIGAGLFLVEVAHTGNQAQSDEEVAGVVQLARGLLRGGVTWTDRDLVTRPLAAEDLLVVAPYNAQVAALRRALLPLGVTHVGTVDKFQGQQAPVVIYSCTSSSAQDAPRGMDFLYDPHRFNVATSRARSTVIVVGSPALFAPECRTPMQVRMANGLSRFRELAKVIAL